MGKSVEVLLSDDLIKCSACETKVSKAQATELNYACPKCGGYFRVKTKNRIRMVADPKSFREWFKEMPRSNPLSFEGYEEKLEETSVKTGLQEGVTIGRAEIWGREVVLGVCDSKFMMGSMGYVVGEKITRAFERATELKLPVILFCCSGGARMQEGIVSLMQMAKTSAACKKHSDAGLLYISILTDPTTGGVTASFAMLGDIILAEPGALIGFAGPRVIEQTIGQKLPQGFQRSEFLLKHGMIDAIVRRENLKETLYLLLQMHQTDGKVAAFHDRAEFDDRPSELIRERAQKAKVKTVWDKVKAARAITRPSALDYINEIFDHFIELHGDRYFGDDAAIVGGVAFLSEQPVTVVGIQKGRNGKECVERNFGMPSPDGYRKAIRLMKQAEKFGRPIITFVNTSGAFCGLEAEERGQGEAIARNLYEMSSLKVPVLCLMIGAGGSGGALALAVGNEVWMMENATYSILSPEGFATILWKDSKRAKEAAEVMKITADDLSKLHIIEKIIPEYGGADDITISAISMFLKKNIKEFLKKYESMSGEEIAWQRIERYRAI